MEPSHLADTHESAPDEEADGDESVPPVNPQLLAPPTDVVGGFDQFPWLIEAGIKGSSVDILAGTLGWRYTVKPWFAAGADLSVSPNGSQSLYAIGEIGGDGGLHGPYVSVQVGGRRDESRSPTYVLPTLGAGIGVRALWASGFLMDSSLRYDGLLGPGSYRHEQEVAFAVSFGWAPRPPGIEVVKGMTPSAWVVTIGVPCVIIGGGAAIWWSLGQALSG